MNYDTFMWHKYAHTGPDGVPFEGCPLCERDRQPWPLLELVRLADRRR